MAGPLSKFISRDKAVNITAPTPPTIEKSGASSDQIIAWQLDRYKQEIEHYEQVIADARNELVRLHTSETKLWNSIDKSRRDVIIGLQTAIKRPNKKPEEIEEPDDEPI